MFSDLWPFVFLKWHFLSFTTVIKVFNSDTMHAANADFGAARSAAEGADMQRKRDKGLDR